MLARWARREGNEVEGPSAGDGIDDHVPVRIKKGDHLSRRAELRQKSGGRAVDADGRPPGECAGEAAAAGPRRDARPDAPPTTRRRRRLADPLRRACPPARLVASRGSPRPRPPVRSRTSISCSSATACGQRTLEIGALRRQIGRSPPLFGCVAERQAGEFDERARIPQGDRIRPHGKPFQPFQRAQLLKQARRIRESWMPAPVDAGAAACSSTVTAKPCRESASAAESPAMPAPATMTGGPWAPAGTPSQAAWAI